MPAWFCLQLGTKDKEKKNNGKIDSTPRRKKKKKQTTNLRWDLKKIIKRTSEKSKTNFNTQHCWTVSKSTVTFLQDFRD